MALMISSLVDIPAVVAELLLVVAAGELLRVVTVGEVLLGESWLFIFVAHNLEVLFGSWVPLRSIASFAVSLFGFFFVFLRVLCG